MRNFRIVLRCAAVILIFAAVLWLLDLALYPCTYIRNDVHAITTRQVDDLYLGTSHGKMNINPAVIEEATGRTGYNMANGNEYPVDSYFLTRLAIESGNTPSRVIYVTTPEYFAMEKEEGHNYLLFYHEFPLSWSKADYFMEAVASCNIRTLLFPWYEYPLSTEIHSMGETIRRKLSGDYSGEAFSSTSQTWQEDGHIARKPVDPATFTMPEYEPFDAEDVVEENLEWICRLIRLCQDNDVEFIAVTPPMASPVLEKNAESFQNADKYFTDFFTEQGVKYINFNAEPYDQLFTHSVKAFSDLEGHMHADAAADFSRVLAKTMEESVS